jgi:hypothetical protein
VFAMSILEDYGEGMLDTYRGGVVGTFVSYTNSIKKKKDATDHNLLVVLRFIHCSVGRSLRVN